MFSVLIRPDKRGFGKMDGVSWSTSRSQESFSRTTPTAETLSRLASFIARSETRPHTQKQRQQPSHLPLYVCQECGKGFPYAADVLKHQELKHALPKPHRCPACGQTFSLKSSLQLHKCNQDSTQTGCCCGLSRFGSPCPACMTRTSNPVRLQDNSLHHPPLLLDSSPYACALCGRSFSQKQALLHHQQAGCSRPSSPPNTADACSLPESPPVSEGDSARSDASDTPGPSCRDTGVCQVCSRTFPTESALQRHKRLSHTGEKSGEGCGGGEVGGANGMLKSQKKLLSCRSCDMVFRCTSTLNMHRKEKHSREKKLREPRPVILKRRKAGKYPCQVCNKVFFHHLSLRAHVRRHTASPFSSVNNGSQHEGCLSKEAEPSENKPNKVTVTGSDVEEEEEQEKEFPCPSCAEVFSLQQLLKEHMELHQSSVRRRQCSVCTTEMDSCTSSGSKRQRLYHCVPCQQGFSALGSFLQHCQEHLRARVEEDQISASFTQQDRKA
ncbi:zinc finger protein 883 isoform X2 [Nothobranchius furzeri]|uniref:zinc finger protein 883 isoform X2 n=1 Tax=Nothobranchius furzeri TaxID=105023 RepID=UPI002404333B|nr:zinc finger protein 184 isoform X2 [Nothobranchius furzeri]